MKKVCTILFFLFLLSETYAQHTERVNTISFNVNEGLLQSQIHSIAFDKYNFTWLSFFNGIQKFDGARFSSVEVQDGLPDDKNVNFFSAADGTLYISHSYGISKYEAASDRFSLIKKYFMKQKFAPIFLGEYNDKIYAYSSNKTVLSFEVKNYERIEESPQHFGFMHESGFIHTFSNTIAGGQIATIRDERIVLFNLKTNEIAASMPKIENLGYYFLHLTSDKDVYFYVFDPAENGYAHLKKYNFISRKTTDILKVKRNNSTGFKSSLTSIGNYQYFSLYDHLYRNNPGSFANNEEIVNIQNQPITGQSYISTLTQDRLGNIYVLTSNDGFKIITPNSYGLKYYGKQNKGNDFIISICADKANGRVLAGTYGNGLLIYDTMQRIIKHIKFLPGQINAFTPINIVKAGDGGYILFCFGKKNGWKLSRDLNKIVEIPVVRNDNKPILDVGYYGNILRNTAGECVVQSESRVYFVAPNKKSILQKEVEVLDGYNGTLYKNKFVTFSNDSLLFYSADYKHISKRTPLPQTGAVRCMTADKNYIYVGGNKGVFKVDSLGKIIFHFTKKDGLPDECIYAMNIQENGDLWCSTNRGLFKLTPSLQILRITKEDGLQENEFNTSAVAIAEDGELFFGGVNGVSSFYPQNIVAKTQKTDIIFTSIKINNKPFATDSLATWQLKKLELDHTQNSLAFEFIAQLVGNPAQLVYQYKMEGVDKDWLQNDDLQAVRYFLAPGRYVFKVYASNIFTPDAKAMKSIEIIIKPPYYSTWWFRLILFALAIVLIYYIVSRSQAVKYKKKLSAMAHQAELQNEREKISKDLHDSIGAYANVVLYKTEMLKDEKDPEQVHDHVSDLEFATKDIIVSLRENIWALKQDNFTAEECYLRIKTFLHAITRYYPQINFRSKGLAPATTLLHYRNALHIVRMVQESVTNAIKHSAAENITVESKEENEVWEIQITDDGEGFDYDHIKTEDLGYGLKNMEHRAAEAGFKLSIKSIASQGTEIKIFI